MSLPYFNCIPILVIAKLSVDFPINCWCDECMGCPLEFACRDWVQFVCAARRHTVKIVAEKACKLWGWFMCACDWYFLNPYCTNVVACMSVLESVVIGLYYQNDFTIGMLSESDQLIDCVVYAWDQAGGLSPKFDQSHMLVALFARRYESVVWGYFGIPSN